MKIVVATHNEGKLVEIRNILTEQLSAAAQGIELVSAGSLDLADPAETGVTFEENALLKARFVAAATGLPAIADDSGLIVDVMGNAPGILSARWSGTHGDDAANNRLLLAQIEDIPDDDRTARFRCAAALVVPVESDGDGLGEFHETVALGEMPGTIVRHPHGMNGFGYDPIFMPDEQPQSAHTPITAASPAAANAAARLDFLTDIIFRSPFAKRYRNSEIIIYRRLDRSMSVR